MGVDATGAPSNGVAIGIDAGQSTIRIQVDGEPAPRTTAGLGHPSTPEQLVDRVARALADVSASRGAGRVGRVVAGLTTLPADERARRQLAGALRRRLGASEVWVTGDEVVAHAGAFGGAPGAVLVVGTGVAALAADPERGAARWFDGAGYLIGDEGGGFWLGRHAVRAALAAAEGRASPTLLEALVVDRFGSLDGLPTRLHAEADAVDRIAHAALDVLAAAADGDAVAAELIDTAADRLVVTAVAALAALPPGSPLALGGRLLASGSPLLDAVRARLTERLATTHSDATHPIELAPPSAGLRGATAIAADDPADYLRWATGDLGKDDAGPQRPNDTSAAERYLSTARRVLDDVGRHETPAILDAAGRLADTVAADGLIHVFGTGHSHLLAEEVFYRAGGLIAIDPILVPSLMLHESATRSTELERSAELVDEVLAGVTLDPVDTIVVASNSGGQAVTIAVVERCRAAGLTVIAVVGRRHAATKPTARVLELADVVIDNHGVVGDAVVNIDGVGPAVGPTSTVAGAAIMQALVAATVEELARRGLDPAVLRSANTPGGDAYNERLLASVRGRVRSL